MTHRRFLRWLLAVGFVSVLNTQAYAQVTEAYFEIQKLDLWPTRYFMLTPSEGAPIVGYADSALFANYTFYNAQYTPFAQANSEHRSVSSTLFFAGGVLRVADKTGSPIGTLRGHYFTLHRAKFTLENAHGIAVACATLNRRGNAVVVTDPAQPMRVLARLERQAGPGEGVLARDDFWAVLVYDTEAIAPDMLRTLATYIIDYQDWFLWSAHSLDAGDLASTVRNKTLEMTTEASVKAGAQSIGIPL